MEAKKFLLTLLKSGIVFGAVLFLMMNTPPIRRPYICNDISLSYPRKKDTVGTYAILNYGILFPFLFILITEIILNWKKVENFKKALNPSWTNLAFLYSKYIISFCIGNIIMVTIKLSTGSHRHIKNCTPGTLVHDFKCANPEIQGFWAEDSAMSFYSGHAQYAAYASVFLVFYLKSRVKTSKFVVLFVQTLLISLAYFISISRVFNNRHWPLDITIGGFLGIFQAIHTWFVQCKNFKTVKNSDKDQVEVLPLRTRSLA